MNKKMVSCFAMIVFIMTLACNANRSGGTTSTLSASKRDRLVPLDRQDVKRQLHLDSNTTTQTSSHKVLFAAKAHMAPDLSEVTVAACYNVVDRELFVIIKDAKRQYHLELSSLSRDVQVIQTRLQRVTGQNYPQFVMEYNAGSAGTRGWVEEWRLIVVSWVNGDYRLVLDEVIQQENHYDDNESIMEYTYRFQENAGKEELLFMDGCQYDPSREEIRERFVWTPQKSHYVRVDSTGADLVLSKTESIGCKEISPDLGRELLKTKGRAQNDYYPPEKEELYDPAKYRVVYAAKCPISPTGQDVIIWALVPCVRHKDIETPFGDEWGAILMRDNGIDYWDSILCWNTDEFKINRAIVKSVAGTKYPQLILDYYKGNGGSAETSNLAIYSWQKDNYNTVFLENIRQEHYSEFDQSKEYCDYAFRVENDIPEIVLTQKCAYDKTRDEVRKKFLWDGKLGKFVQVTRTATSLK